MEKENKKIYKKWWFWLIIIFIIIILGTGNNNTSNNTPANSPNTNNIEESSNTVATVEEDNNLSNVPSENNYKKYVYEVFDNHYNGSYNISGDKSDWKIITTLNRTKLEGIAIINNNRYNFYIILEFSDDTFTDYAVQYFQIGDEKIIND